MSRGRPYPYVDSMMGRAVAVLANHPEGMSANDYKRALCRVCDTADQALHLNDAMKARGYIERKVVFTKRFFEDAKRMQA